MLVESSCVNVSRGTADQTIQLFTKMVSQPRKPCCQHASASCDVRKGTFKRTATKEIGLKHLQIALL